ncbi:Uncharacterized protein TCM_016439 [Theobroma cacao]|uniref:Uncharacterized protein n=1 Tax=Theobroma cacao TaxID=3641 RepID=A0A061G6E5_THECC|nr:Uncharacterized protein TCM_016439 [Theobroma cacao]
MKRFGESLYPIRNLIVDSCKWAISSLRPKSFGLPSISLGLNFGSQQIVLGMDGDIVILLPLIRCDEVNYVVRMDRRFFWVPFLCYEFYISCFILELWKIFQYTVSACVVVAGFPNP